MAESVDGPLVVCADDPGSREVARRTGAITYGVDPAADWRIIDLTRHDGGTRFELVGPSAHAHVSLGRPGAHVALNAAGALALLGSMGRDVAAAALGLASFRGVGRRWEHRGTVSGVTLIDDYAHHPTEVAATVAVGRDLARGSLWAVFQPHLYSRTARFHDEFGAALSGADEVVITDVYGSREEPVPGVTGAMVVEAVRRHGANAHYVPHRSDLADFLAGRVAEGDLVLTMGAGDITLVPTELAIRLGGAMMTSLESLISLGKILERVPLGPYTTYKSGGPARYLAEVDGQEALDDLVASGVSSALPVLVLGRGSNLVVSDSGFQGLVIRLGPSFGGVKVEGTEVRAGAAAPLAQVARQQCGRRSCRPRVLHRGPRIGRGSRPPERGVLRNRDPRPSHWGRDLGFDRGENGHLRLRAIWTCPIDTPTSPRRGWS